MIRTEQERQHEGSERRIRVGASFRASGLGVGDGARVRPRLPLRGKAPPGVARQVPAARRPPGQEDDRARLDGARPPGGRLLDEAHRGGVAARRARPGARRRATEDGAHGRDVRRGVRGVAALPGARPRPQALDAGRVSLERQGAPGAGVRLAAARGRDGRPDRGLEGDAADEQPHQGQAADGAQRRLRACAPRLQARLQPDGRSRSRASARLRRSRCSRPRRCGRWSGPRTASRTPRYS